MQDNGISKNVIKEIASTPEYYRCKSRKISIDFFLEYRFLLKRKTLAIANNYSYVNLFLQYYLSFH